MRKISRTPWRLEGDFVFQVHQLQEKTRPIGQGVEPAGPSGGG
jgi:hypothetical protein